MKDPLTGKDIVRIGSLADGDMTESLPLQEFLHGLGPLMRLPAKQAPRPEAKAESQPSPADPRDGGRTRRRVSPLMLVTLGVLVSCLGMLWYFSGGVRAIPPELVGTWVAEDARYEGRMFQLTPQVVMLWTANGLEQHKVLDVAERTLADTTTYVIRYEQAGASAEFAFRYVPAADRILFHHQGDMPWHRAAARNF